MTLPAAYRAGAGDDNLEVWKRYVKTRDMKDRDLLVQRYIGLVHSAAWEAARRLSTTLDVDDLVSAGTLGLIQALGTFDPGRGTAFSTWAMPRIRGAMIDEVRSWDWVPRSVRDRNRDASRMMETLRRRLGREPHAAEVADALGIELDLWWRQSADLAGPVFVPLDAAGTEDGPVMNLAELIPDTRTPDASRTMERTEEMEALAEAFETLTSRDRLVLSLSYLEGLTLKQIAEMLRVSESRVSQIRTRALLRLKERIGEGRLAA